MDAITHIYGLIFLKPVNDLLERTAIKGIIFEDNSSSHKTEAVFDYFKE